MLELVAKGNPSVAAFEHVLADLYHFWGKCKLLAVEPQSLLTLVEVALVMMALILQLVHALHHACKSVTIVFLIA